MSYTHSIKDIENASGLSYDIIAKYSRECFDILEDKYLSKDGNKYVYNTNAFGVFDFIKQQRENKVSHQKVKKKLRVMVLESVKVPQNDISKPHKMPQNELQNELEKKLVDALTEAHKATLEVYDKALQSSEKTIQALEKNVLLLTDGRSPEEVRKEREEESKKLRELQREQEKILQANEALQETSEKHKKERSHTAEILQKLQALEGKWFKGEERKALYKELESYKTSAEIVK